ncbi:MAG TPA: hypothetical protein VHF50_01935 [Solirubrobacterales bacterium]|nr:hypothetical protein [Solirubrobacterales bacterium]
MFSSFRNRFGIPGVISVIALVFAMFGGAYAATNNGSGDSKASASAKKAKKGPRGPRGPKGAQGPAGPAGPQGPAGPAGAKGDKGDAGTNGTNGTKGATGPTGATGTTGTTGSPWTAGGTLPKNATMTGSWGFGGDDVSEDGSSLQFIPISFPIPLASEPAADSDNFRTMNAPPTADCPGTAAEPKAAPGNLCVYEAFKKDAENAEAALGLNIAKPTEPLVPGASKYGAVVLYLPTFNPDPEVEVQNNFAYGTWAVTAP